MAPGSGFGWTASFPSFRPLETRIMKKRDRLAVAVKPIIEGLESRRLLATVVPGTTGPDVIVLANGGPATLNVTVNGVTTPIPVGPNETVDIEPDTGDDTVTIQSLPAEVTTVTLTDTGGDDDIDFSGASGNVATTISAGSGNDTIVGNDGDAHIDGGTGDDNITGGDGDNIITGGDGNDTIVTGGGTDSIAGNDGNDSITSDGGNDT